MSDSILQVSTSSPSLTTSMVNIISVPQSASCTVTVNNKKECIKVTFDQTDPKTKDFMDALNDLDNKNSRVWPQVFNTTAVKE